jgi:hypothetical protein
VGRAAVRATAVVHRPSATPALAARPAGVVSDKPGFLTCDLDQDRVDVGPAFARQLLCGRRDLGEKIVQGATDEDVLVERHRPSLRDDDRHIATHL